MLTAELQIGSEFQPQVQRATALIDRGITQAMAIAAMEAANDARRRAPYKTGTLRRSIQVIELGPKQVAVGSELPYAARVEFGFAGADSLGRVYSQAAQPYLRPAIEETRRRVEQIFREEVKRVLGS